MNKFIIQFILAVILNRSEASDQSWKCATFQSSPQQIRKNLNYIGDNRLNFHYPTSLHIFQLEIKDTQVSAEYTNKAKNGTNFVSYSANCSTNTQVCKGERKSLNGKKTNSRNLTERRVKHLQLSDSSQVIFNVTLEPNYIGIAFNDLFVNREMVSVVMECKR